MYDSVVLLYSVARELIVIARALHWVRKTPKFQNSNWDRRAELWCGWLFSVRHCWCGWYHGCSLWGRKHFVTFWLYGGSFVIAPHKTPLKQDHIVLSSSYILRSSLLDIVPNTPNVAQKKTRFLEHKISRIMILNTGLSLVIVQRKKTLMFAAHVENDHKWPKWDAQRENAKRQKNTDVDGIC